MNKSKRKKLMRQKKLKEHRESLIKNISEKTLTIIDEAKEILKEVQEEATTPLFVEKKEENFIEIIADYKEEVELSKEKEIKQPEKTKVLKEEKTIETPKETKKITKKKVSKRKTKRRPKKVSK